MINIGKKKENKDIDTNSTEVDIKKSKLNLKIKRRSKILLISLSCVLVVIIAVFCVYYFYQKMHKITFDNYELYQYFSGIRYDYDGTVSLERKKKITNIKSKDLSIDSGNIPIYYQKIDNQAIFPIEMELIFPSMKNKYYRVSFFSQSMVDVVDNHESSFLIYGGDTLPLDVCFFYDGEDLYFFPYSTTIVIDDETYELSPLSYIIVNYQDQIEMYDKVNDKYTMIDTHEKDVIATLQNYKINLSTDMIMYSDNDLRLLLKNVDKLPIYEVDKKKK